MDNQIERYKSVYNNIELQVDFDFDTVWLNRQQLALLFDSDIKISGKHIIKIFLDEALDAFSTASKFTTVQIEATAKRLFGKRLCY